MCAARVSGRLGCVTHASAERRTDADEASKRSRAPGRAASASAKSGGTTMASMSLSESHEPLARARSTASMPAAVIRPAAVRRSTRSLFVRAQVLFAREVGDKLLVLFTDQTYSLPKSILSTPANLRAVLSGITKQAAGAKYVLVSPGEASGVGFQSLFPEALPFYAEKLDEKQIAANLQNLRQPRPFSAGKAAILNGLPLPDQLEAVGLKGQDPKLWTGKFASLDATLKTAAFPSMPVGATSLRDALTSNPAFLMVVAHSDGTTIYLPDNTQFSIDKLTDADVAKLQEVKPFIFFLSCDTGTVAPGAQSFAKNLLDKGPSLVAAPSGQLPVDSANELVKNFLADPAREKDVLQAFFHAVQTTFPGGLIPNPSKAGGGDQFFKFIIGEVFQARLAA